MNNTIDLWHRFIKTSTPDERIQLLNQILDDDVVFYSPVVYTPQQGKKMTIKYLMGAAMILNHNFKYTKELISKESAVLEFECTIDDIIVEGVDIITMDSDSGLIKAFKVMIRPLQAMNIVHQKMGVLLAGAK